MSAISPAWATLLLGIVIALFVYAGFRVRRAREEHQARSDERAAAFMLALQRERSTAGKAQAPAPPAQSAAISPATPSTAPAAATLRRKPRLLTQAQRLLFLLLRSAMPECVVLANVRLIDLADVAPGQAQLERDPRLRQLLHERADCVVCNTELVPLAALVVYEAGIERVPDERIKIEALREMDVKFLRLRADNLPRPAEMRALVLG
jgi:hypothetical protein